MLRKNATYMALGQGARVLVQALGFLLIARALGPQQYGAFVAVAAAVAIASPFVGNGSGNLMVKRVACDPTVLPEALGNALLVTLISGLLLSFLVTPACLALLPPAIPSAVIVLVIASDLLVLRFVDVVCLGFQAIERLDWTAGLNLFASLTRLAGIAAVVLLARPTVLAWSVAYLITSVLCALAALGCLLCRLACPRFSGYRTIRSELCEGFWFSTSLSAQSIYNDLDKTMLASATALDAAGIYSGAYRLIEVAFVPVRALLAASYPAFFRHGKNGLAGSFAFAQRLLRKPLLYAMVVAAGMVIGAPIVPRILGSGYARSSEALRWLSLLPVLKTLHYFAADVLTGAGYQFLRTLLQIAVASLNILLNLWLIPAYSWRGAAWSSLASDALLAAGLWSCALLVRTRDVRAAMDQATLTPADLNA
jgi:O-antigen/teichoic acid export membrane protein